MVDLDDDRLYDFVRMVAAPVFGADGTVLAAATATGFPAGLPAARVLTPAAGCETPGALASRQSGGRPPA